MSKNRNEKRLFFIKNYGIFFRSLMIISLFWFAMGCSDSGSDGGILSTNPECAITGEGSRSFWVYNLKTQSYDCIKSELKREGSGTATDGTGWSYKVYVDSDDSSVTSTVSESILTEIKTKLDSIVPTTIGVFGPPPQTASLVESAVIFFITDIKENEPCTGCYTAGFFDPTHQSGTSSKSNRVNMLVFDYIPLENPANFPDFHNTIAHELQHLIHYSYDQQEETWLDEGLAEVSSSINQATTGRSLFDPDDGETCGTAKTFYNCAIKSVYPLSLPSWEGSTKHYWKTSLFFKYLCEKEGKDNCAKTLRDIVSSTNKGIYSVEAALSQLDSQNALGNNISNFTTLKTNLSDTDYKNFTAIYQSWLVAMSKVAYDNFAGSLSISTSMEDHRYKTFSRSYPYWNYVTPTLSDPISYTSFEPFSAVYIDWSAGPGHGTNVFSTNFDKIKIITIAPNGDVDFSGLANLSNFKGMEIVYNINPFYALSVSSDTSVQTVTNLDSLENTITNINVTAKIQTSVGQDYSEGINNISGYLISIGSLPLNEISVRNSETGKSYALSGKLVKDLAQNLGEQVSLAGFLSGELSKRNQEIFEVISFEFL